MSLLKNKGTTITTPDGVSHDPRRIPGCLTLACDLFDRNITYEELPRFSEAALKGPGLVTCLGCLSAGPSGDVDGVGVG